jgi:hypothetical protein
VSTPTRYTQNRRSNKKKKVSHDGSIRSDDSLMYHSNDDYSASNSGINGADVENSDPRLNQGRMIYHESRNNTNHHRNSIGSRSSNTPITMNVKALSKAARSQQVQTHAFVSSQISNKNNSSSASPASQAFGYYGLDIDSTNALNKSPCITNDHNNNHNYYNNMKNSGHINININASGGSVVCGGSGVDVDVTTIFHVVIIIMIIIMIIRDTWRFI